MLPTLTGIFSSFLKVKLLLCPSALESHFHLLNHLDVLLGVSGLDWGDEGVPFGMPQEQSVRPDDRGVQVVGPSHVYWRWSWQKSSTSAGATKVCKTCRGPKYWSSVRHWKKIQLGRADAGQLTSTYNFPHRLQSHQDDDCFQSDRTSWPPDLAVSQTHGSSEHGRMHIQAFFLDARHNSISHRYESRILLPDDMFLKPLKHFKVLIDQTCYFLSRPSSPLSHCDYTTKFK